MTQKALDKLPQEIRERIEKYRKCVRAFNRLKNVYINQGIGYTEALRDAGIITERERSLLSVYIML